MVTPFNQILHFWNRVPVLRQSSLEECGLVCLAMVSSFYGYQTDLNELRSRFSLMGARLQDLMNNARALKLDARPLKLDLDELKKLRLPAILHWDMDHFVVLVKLRRDRALVHDPAIGARWYSRRELSDHFTGVALECQPASDFEVKRRVHKLKITDLWNRSHGVLLFIVQLCALSLVLQALSLAAPFYMQLVVDEGLQRRDHDLITLLACGFAAFLLIQVLIEAVRSWVAQHVGHRLSFQMNSNLMFHLLRLPLLWYERRSLGDITSRAGSLDPVHSMLTEGFFMFVIDGIMAISTLALMFWYGWELTAVVLTAVVLFTVIKFFLYPRIRQRNEEQIVAGAEQETHVLETLRNMSAVKIFGREKERYQRWQNHHARIMKASYQEGTLGIFAGLADTLLFGIENILLIYLAAQAIIASEMSIGMLFAFMAYKNQFTNRMTSLIGRILELRMLSLHLERLADICFESPEVGVHERQVQVPMAGALSLNTQKIGYEGYAPVLTEVDVQVPAGQMVLIAGASGVGKTTLIRSMMGLLSTEQGLRVDGIPVGNFGIENYRRKIAAVMQNDSLLAGTILENITFFDSSANQERMDQILALVELDEELRHLPLGLHTQVGDLGSALSSGQAQRVLLARALYAEPQVLFLDEVTSHLDHQLAMRLLDRIGALSITRVIIDHRPDILQWTDLVYLVEGGRVAKLDPEILRQRLLLVPGDETDAP